MIGTTLELSSYIFLYDYSFLGLIGLIYTVGMLKQYNYNLNKYVS